MQRKEKIATTNQRQRENREQYEMYGKVNRNFKKYVKSSLAHVKSCMYVKSMLNYLLNHEENIKEISTPDEVLPKCGFFWEASS